MPPEQALACYRMEQARQNLNSARLLADAEDYKSAANRSYYCVFHAMRSLLALQGKDFKKHSGVISEFRREYIKSGLLDASLSQTLTVLFRVRTQCDYDDFYLIDKQEVMDQIQSAEAFLQTASSYLFGVLDSGANT